MAKASDFIPSGTGGGGAGGSFETVTITVPKNDYLVSVGAPVVLDPLTGMFFQKSYMYSSTKIAFRSSNGEMGATINNGFITFYTSDGKQVGVHFGVNAHSATVRCRVYLAALATSTSVTETGGGIRAHAVAVQASNWEASRVFEVATNEWVVIVRNIAGNDYSVWRFIYNGSTAISTSSSLTNLTGVLSTNDLDGVLKRGTEYFYYYNSRVFKSSATNPTTLTELTKTGSFVGYLGYSDSTKSFDVLSDGRLVFFRVDLRVKVYDVVGNSLVEVSELINPETPSLAVKVAPDTYVVSKYLIKYNPSTGSMDILDTGIKNISSVSIFIEDSSIIPSFYKVDLVNNKLIALPKYYINGISNSVSNANSRTYYSKLGFAAWGAGLEASNDATITSFIFGQGSYGDANVGTVTCGYIEDIVDDVVTITLSNIIPSKNKLIPFGMYGTVVAVTEDYVVPLINRSTSVIEDSRDTTDQYKYHLGTFFSGFTSKTLNNNDNYLQSSTYIFSTNSTSGVYVSFAVIIDGFLRHVSLNNIARYGASTNPSWTYLLSISAVRNMTLIANAGGSMYLTKLT